MSADARSGGPAVARGSADPAPPSSIAQPALTAAAGLIRVLKPTVTSAPQADSPVAPAVVSWRDRGRRTASGSSTTGQSFQIRSRE